MFCERTRRECPIKALFAKRPRLEKMSCPHCIKQYENDETIRRYMMEFHPQSRQRVDSE